MQNLAMNVTQKNSRPAEISGRVRPVIAAQDLHAEGREDHCLRQDWFRRTGRGTIAADPWNLRPTRGPAKAV